MQVYLPIAELSLNVVLLLLMGFAIGFLSGMFGVGGGFILTPLLIFLGVPSAVAVGTSISQVVAASVSSAVGHWRRNNVDMKMGLLLIAGGFVGAMLWWGHEAQRRLDAEIAAIRARGEPILIEDFTVQPVPDSENAALLLRKAAAAPAIVHHLRFFVRAV